MVLGRPTWLEYAEQRTVEREAAWTNRTLEIFNGSPDSLTTHMYEDITETGETITRQRSETVTGVHTEEGLVYVSASQSGETSSQGITHSPQKGIASLVG